jgi:cytochrome c oxidase assembly protein subunit 15
LNSNSNFTRIAKITLVLIYVVIIAGAIVRMTGSGMGCPDWPKCFGYYIPPTEQSQLEFKPNHEYKKGVVIIKDETLVVAKSDFTSSENYEEANWQPYTKHDYAIFNPIHTWVEYINRLSGAVSGLATLVLAIASLQFWKKKKIIPILSFLVVFAMGFQAWLGKTVVDSNLSPLKITIHMVMALLIVAIMLIIIYKSKSDLKSFTYNPTFKNVMLFAIMLTLVQVILGTQVRQYVDEQVKAIGYVKSAWLENPQLTFYIHRTLSILVIITTAWLVYLNKKLRLGYKKVNAILILVLLEILTGMLMYYFDFPFSTQTLHLVIASILFGIQFYLLMESHSKKIEKGITI